jgi:metal-responsive CopG/Arc/MetJ family transcriptional regulator
MPTPVHIPAALLKSVDRREKALGVNRNRLIIRALEQAVRERSSWSPEFIERLQNVDRETSDAVDD